VLIHGHDLTMATHRCTETISAVRTICHPSYSSDTMVADICLLQLQRPASCGTELLNRGALAHLDAVGSGFATVGSTITVAGWGRTDYNGHGAQPGVPRYPSIAREADIPVISNTQCAQQYGYGQIRTDMLCAGAAGVDSCSGDSGGPLFVLSDGRAYQVAIVSWGRGCALASFAGVNARVATYRSWIISHVPSLGRPVGPPAPPAPPAPPSPPPPPPSPPMPPRTPPSLPGTCGATCHYNSDGDCERSSAHEAASENDAMQPSTA
jgi:secreted trypsin-like serine protease